MAHILIVEDEENIARMIEATLTLGNHTSQWCPDGAQAVEQIENGQFGLVLLDVMLPGLDGFAVMDRLQGQDVPVIFLSAMQQVEDKVRGLRLGAEDYISKPFEPLELLARIEVVLRRRRRGTDGRSWTATPSPSGGSRCPCPPRNSTCCGCFCRTRTWPSAGKSC